MNMKMFYALIAILSVSGLAAMQPCTLPCKSKYCEDSGNDRAPHMDSRAPHVNLFVNALYWKPREEGLDYVIKNSTGATFINSGSVQRAEFDWNGGFRVGLGYCNPDCPMGFNAYYTRFTTSGCDCITTTSFPEVLFPVWSNPSTSVVTEQEAQASVCLSLNVFDAQLSTVLSPNDCVNIMPVLGLRYARINQRFNINSNGGQSQGPIAFVLDDATTMKNNFWGVGPKVGINTTWGFWGGFSIFGAMDLALLYGKFDITQKETISFSDDVPETTFLDIQCNRFHLTRPNLGLILGLQWLWQRGRYEICLSAGWEHQYFFGQNQLMRFSDDVNPGVNTAVQGDLSLQGLTAAVSFSF